MGKSSGSSNQMTLVIANEHDLVSHLPRVCLDPSRGCAEGGSCASSIEEIIENSKSHWSQVEDFDSNNEVAKVSNMELFKSWQGHPSWGKFFVTFGKGEDSRSELVMGKKFAEGGQAKLYEVQIKWNSLKMREQVQKKSIEYVLKVFKKGTLLQHLQLQWPQGMLQFHVDTLNREKLGLSHPLRFHCDVYCGTLLEDGRFAFVLVKEKEDLRSMINRRMMITSNNEGPFSKKEALEAMYEVAFGMDQLHNQGIVHRDIKASNVLLSSNMVCLIADFECPIGVVGTGFFRAPEVLEACKHGNASMKIELFTKAVDIYSYGMICYEILTGKLPFEGHPCRNYDVVLQGQRPKVPNYVDGWIQKLLDRCWQSNPVARPSSQEILETLRANSPVCRKLDLLRQRQEVKLGIRKVLDRRSKILEIWRSLKLRLQNLKMFRSCKK